MQALLFAIKRTPTTVALTGSGFVISGGSSTAPMSFKGVTVKPDFGGVRYFFPSKDLTVRPSR